jgi:hypothetical protein
MTQQTDHQRDPSISDIHAGYVQSDQISRKKAPSVELNQ